jgi:peptidoglycan/xylan/chitin deacetylase (PgdA/CDA1 family)
VAALVVVAAVAALFALAPGRSAGAAALGQTVSVPIITYHLIEDQVAPSAAGAGGLVVSALEFGQQMDYLAIHGFHPVTLSDVSEAVAGRMTLPPKAVAITFDDGNRDNFTEAYPILRARGFVATFFVITGFVGRPSCVTWDQLRTMQQGGMEIGSHTVDHRRLTSLSEADLLWELRASRKALLANLGAAPAVLSYPFGGCNDAVKAAAASAGYAMAVTTHLRLGAGPASPFEVSRVTIKPGEGLDAFVFSVL